EDRVVGGGGVEAVGGEFGDHVLHGGAQRRGLVAHGAGGVHDEDDVDGRGAGDVARVRLAVGVAVGDEPVGDGPGVGEAVAVAVGLAEVEDAVPVGVAGGGEGDPRLRRAFGHEDEVGDGVAVEVADDRGG